MCTDAANGIFTAPKTYSRSQKILEKNVLRNNKPNVLNKKKIAL